MYRVGRVSRLDREYAYFYSSLHDLEFLPGKIIKLVDQAVDLELDGAVKAIQYLDPASILYQTCISDAHYVREIKKRQDVDWK